MTDAYRHHLDDKTASRRSVMFSGLAAASALATLPNNTATAATKDANGPSGHSSTGVRRVSTIKTKDGVEIFYKDWGKGQPIVFSHGWPLSADDWDAQMLFFLNHGYRVIAHDRRGHGRSTQVGDGHDMDHYADDLAAVTAHLDLKNAIHVGHSTGGGEVVHYLGRHGESRVAKAAIISAVPPLMVKTTANPNGLPKEVFDDFQGAARGQPLGILSRRRFGAFLQLQQDRKAVRSHHPELVAPGHDGRCESPLRRHRRFFADRFHRRPQEDQCAGAGDAQRGRSDRPLRRRRALVGKAFEERNVEERTKASRTACRPRKPTRSMPICLAFIKLSDRTSAHSGQSVMAFSKHNSLSRRRFCLCCVGARRLCRHWRLAFATRGLRRSARPGQPDQGQRRGLADRHA